MTTESLARPGPPDQEALRRRYAEERDKRLRPDGNDQYLRLTGAFARHLDDPGKPRAERMPLTDHRTAVCIGGGFAGLQDGWTDIARRIRARIALLPPEDLSPAAMLAAYQESDFEKMEEIRARADAIVRDPGTASKLKAWYRQLCKRPCFHDEYLQAFNNQNTHLVDTGGKGVEQITATGVVAAGREYELDCII